LKKVDSKDFHTIINISRNNRPLAIPTVIHLLSVEDCNILRSTIDHLPVIKGKLISATVKIAAEFKTSNT
jgi:hypothetical protein